MLVTQMLVNSNGKSAFDNTHRRTLIQRGREKRELIKFSEKRITVFFNKHIKVTDWRNCPQ
jgi:hypothetical protein